MKTSKKLVQAIVGSISNDVAANKKEGEVKGYEPMRYSIDIKPKNILFSFPLNQIIDDARGTVYIGGKTN